MASRAHPIHQSKHYIQFTISPPTTDVLTLRKHLSDCLEQAFGTTSASTNIDVLWLADDGKEMVIRLHPNDAAKVLAAVVSSTEGPRISLVRESPVLPVLAARFGEI